jgi:hypothetical protein
MGIDVYGDVKNISEEKVRKLVNHVIVCHQSGTV